MRKLKLFFALLLLIAVSGCNTVPVDYAVAVEDPNFIHRSMQQLTDVIVHDIFSPPVASRVYVYPSIAAYEAMVPSRPEFITLAGQLTALHPTPQPEEGQEYCFPLASTHAFLIVGKALVFSEDKMEAFEEKVYEEFRAAGVPRAVFERSMAYGKQVAEHILAWADKDNYKETRTFPKYTVRDELEAWKPTPPDYMEGIEPHWNKIRPFVVDSATQFIPARPTQVDMEEGSPFYDEVLEVYETAKNLTEEQKEIAEFWDCNPYVSHHQGHVMFATKKITPGGHWVGITKIVSKKSDLDMMETLEAYARVSISLADAFISCWDEKWRSIYVRPETLINQFIDEDWVPLLQTPPFPEYTSGHSVISASAATALTHLLGEPYLFIDSTEVAYGLPPRTFESFFDASKEAAISRLYGGIHYMPAINNGVEQGKLVGNFIVENLRTRREAVSLHQ